MLTIKRGEVRKSEHAENAEYGYSFVCRTCPYEFVIDREYYTRRVSKVKEVDDVMGGAAAWENVDQTNGKRQPVCNYVFPLETNAPLLLIVLFCIAVARAPFGLLALLPLVYGWALTNSPDVLE